MTEITCSNKTLNVHKNVNDLISSNADTKFHLYFYGKFEFSMCEQKKFIFIDNVISDIN